MAFEQYWQKKSHADLMAASERLHEYTDVAQQSLLGELQRRGVLGLLKDGATTVANEELQFDRAVPVSADSPPRPTPAAVCSGCHSLIETEYLPDQRRR